MVKYECKEKFRNFNNKKDRLDVFLGNYIATAEEYKDLWYVCKVIFVLSHGQSNIERGFSVNRKILQDNLQEKSLITQRLIYDTLNCSDLEPHQFAVSSELRKSCKFAHAKYKADLDKQKEGKVAAEKALKRKNTTQELDNAKKQKVELAKCIDALKVW